MNRLEEIIFFVIELNSVYMTNEQLTYCRNWYYDFIKLSVNDQYRECMVYLNAVYDYIDKIISERINAQKNLLS